MELVTDSTAVWTLRATSDSHRQTRWTAQHRHQYVSLVHSLVMRVVAKSQSNDVGVDVLAKCIITCGDRKRRKTASVQLSVRRLLKTSSESFRWFMTRTNVTLVAVATSSDIYVVRIELPQDRSRRNRKLNKTSITGCVIGDDGMRTLTCDGVWKANSDPPQFQRPQVLRRPYVTEKLRTQDRLHLCLFQKLKRCQQFR